MRATRPRQLTHVGHVSATGLIIDTQLLGEAEARRRVLALWSPGVTITALETGWVVRFPAPRLLSAHRAPGTLLVTDAGVPSAAPLTTKERASLKPDPAGIVVVQGGAAKVAFPSHEPIHPGSWLDVSAFRLVAVSPLAAPPPPLIPMEVAAPVDARARLVPGLGAPPIDQAEIIRALNQHGTAPPKSNHSELSLTVMRGAYTLGVGFVSVFAPLLRLMAAALGDGGSTSGGRSGGGTGTGLAKPNALARFLTRMEGWLTRSVMESPLGRLFATRQAQYLSKMLDMFEQGQLDEALRHAIPLGRPGTETSTPALGLPLRRDQLTLSNGQAATSSYLWGGDVHELLRQKYRAAFEALARAGRIDEAAFVLIELLGVYEEAVAFLEKHGKLQLAAEIAESRNLPPGLVIRQWFVAGNRQRALDLARRTGAFADALERMEKSDQGLAISLRLEWADLLASSGRLVAAVELLLPVTRDLKYGDRIVAGARRLVLGWIDRGLELGGPSGARLLAWKSALEPEKFDEVKSRVLTLLKSGDDTLISALGDAFLEVLTDAKWTSEQQKPVRVLSRPLIRTLLAMSPGNTEAFKEASALIGYLGGMMKADLPKEPMREEHDLIALDLFSFNYAFAGHDTGRTPILDAARLPNGRMLLALGDAGARLITRDGRTIAHFDRPAHALVVSDEGDRAIAIGERGDLKLLSRIDLHARTVRPWLEAELSHWAPTYDGATWFASTRDRLHAIDALSDQWREIWSSAPGPTYGLERGLKHLVWLGKTENAVEVWSYSLPDLTLRARTAVSPPPIQFVASRLSGGRVVFVLPEMNVEEKGSTEPAAIDVVHYPPGEPRQAQPRLFGSQVMAIARAGETCDAIVSSRGWLAVALRDENGTRVELRSQGGEKVRVTLNLASASKVSLRFASERLLVIADDQGRSLVVDAVTGDLRSDLRL